MNTEAKKIGKILGNRRRELGFTQLEVAVELGMSIHQYQRYEYGEHNLANSQMHIGLRVCAVLELDPYELILGVG